MTHIEAMKLALEVLRNAVFDEHTADETLEAMKALEEALAKQEQGKSFFKFRECEDSQSNQPKQEQGEPVAWLEGETIYWKEDKGLNDWIRKNGEPLYTTPQQRTWVGLTTKDQKEIQRQSVYVEGAIRMTEAKLKEKNT
jgi:hypothetical protein